MTDPIGTAQERELIERLERSIASNGAWMTSDIRAFYEALRDALQSRIAEVERLTARVRDLEAAAQPFADSIVFDPDKKRGDRHWATFGTTTNIDQVMRLQAALSQHRKL